MNILYKTCSSCQQLLPVEAFHRHRRRRDGLNDVCKPCRQQEWKQHYAAHKPEILARERERHQQNRQQYLAQRKVRHQRFYAKYRDKILAKNKAYVQAHRQEITANLLPAGTKICSKCQILLPVNAFHHRKSGKSGLSSICKSCRNAANRAYAAAHPEKIRRYAVAYYATHHEHVRQYGKTYRAAHPEQECQRHIAYRATMPDEVRQHRAAYSRQYNASHREHISQRNAAYHQAHREEICQRKIQRNNPERRAREKNAPIVESINLDILAARDHWLCHICHRKVTRRTWSMDHLIPLSKGGNHTYDNVALAHRGCNAKRGAGRLPAQLRLLP